MRSIPAISRAATLLVLTALASAPAWTQGWESTEHKATARDITPAAVAARGLLLAPEPAFAHYRLLQDASSLNLSAQDQGSDPAGRSVGPQPVAAGAEVWNGVTREFGTVTGYITVLADVRGLYPVARELGLHVVPGIGDARVGQIQAPPGADLVRLAQQLRQHPNVLSARIEVREPRQVLHHRRHP